MRMTSSATLQTRKSFGKKRIDILIGEQLVPSALIGTHKLVCVHLTNLVDDIAQDTDNHRQVGPSEAESAWRTCFRDLCEGASGSCVVANDFEREYSAIEAAVKAGLQGHVAAHWPNYEIDVSLLSKEVCEADVDESSTIQDNGAGSFICAAMLITAGRCKATDGDRSSRLAHLCGRTASTPDPHS